ncbi:PQQ-dependent sugar dehydrogenase [Streptomyces sp. NPDC091272]|uniref:PQQ-dependent sugar dehydrogenase n=1 Tax=Streptomyces sp. NPDC091272 TaxID=3365981 RepID=UPI0037FE2F27
MRRIAVPAALTAAALLLVAGCSEGGPAGRPPADKGSSAPPGEPTGSAVPSATTGTKAAPAKGSATVTATVAKDLKSPWGLVALPDGDLLVSSRDEGTLTRVDAKSGKATAVGRVAGASPAGEGGLMGLALSPSYATDHQVYAYFTTESDNRIARMLYDEKRPAGQQLGAADTVFKGIPKGTVHNGGRIAFGPDKMLYAGTGETGERGLAQDPKSLAGKILRMTPDGQPVHGNPAADSVVYSLGHRNVQGLAWDEDRRLWAAEFGQDTWDELNLIEPGKNYGWPEVEGQEHRAGFVDPVAQWKTSDASPSGIAFAQGSVWMAGLRGERLWRIPLDGAKPVAAPEAFLTEKYGRLRTVLAPGGAELLVVTNETDSRGTPEPGDDRILKVRVK